MTNSIEFSGRPFHFIGIGGIGMSALAYVVAKRNLPVSGSDLRLTHITQRLQENGAHIFWTQDGSNLKHFQADSEQIEGGDDRFLPQVICSTAIQAGNAEYKSAVEIGCPIFHRSDVLAGLMDQYEGIAIAGTHGKTTTSSLVGHMLVECGVDPTIVVGGEVNAWGGNARVGQGPHLVAEADESDGSLVKLNAKIGVITNIELDHPDHYTSLEQVVDIFRTFIGHCDTWVGCLDCPTVRSLQPSISYSLDLDSEADYRVDCIAYRGEGTTARVWEQGTILGQLNVQLLGSHNLSNALAAVAIGRKLGLEFDAIARAIATFSGARRRFELRGEANDIVFIDDYAHHPSELVVTLAAARLQTQSVLNPRRRVVAVFQPHRYSRTKAFLPEFAAAFDQADVVVLSDIYSAGEAPMPGVSGEVLAKAVQQHQEQSAPLGKATAKVHYAPTLPEVSQVLERILQPGDIVMFLGAGNLNQLIPEAVASQMAIASAVLCHQA
jgi:UDP-N-acetylmuramate--alanine ligase